METKNRAIIDIGTNSVKMIIHDQKDGLSHIISEEKEVVQIGAESFNSRYIREDKIALLIDVLSRFLKIAAGKNCEKTDCYATAAIRESKNRDDILFKLKQTLGIDVTILSEEEEGQFIFAAVSKYHPSLNKEDILVVDIGGGSAELVRARQGEMLKCESRPLGGVRLKDLFMREDKATPDEIKLVEKYIQRLVGPFFEKGQKKEIEKVVFTGGTPNAILKNAQGKTEAHIRENLYPLALKDIVSLRDVLIKLKPNDRYSKFDFEKGRAELAIPTASVMKVVLACLDHNTCYVSKVGLREGILTSRGGTETPKNEDQKEKTLIKVLQKYEADMPHAKKVNEFAMIIFEALKGDLRYKQKEERLIFHASYLHDIGTFVDYGKHHKHSEYLIENTPIVGLDNNEKKLISQIARYHRKSLPSPKHEKFIKLTEENRQKVLVLVAMLRIADSLDRGHNNAVKTLAVKTQKNKLEITVDGKGNDVTLETWALEKHKDLIKEALGLDLTVTVLT
ncbi:MAG: Ppx/GppA family phosphatase [Deltaproteobacteria bacterium]|nr:Ppx/GppA family phosphatase [Deltaproteobacteria bacterium]